MCSFSPVNFNEFNINVYNMVSQGVQSAPMQEVQQLTSLLNQACQSFSTLVDTFQDFVGTSLSQLPGSGFVNYPSPMEQYPVNPSSQGIPGHEKSGLIQSGKHPPKFVTPGGYTIEAEGKGAGWKITTPDGKTTKVWGDPHVKESDGGKWNFKSGMSFVLPDGTKITAKTTPPLKNGYTVTQSIDIMNGNERATISGIDKNQPSSDGVHPDRWSVDARVPDGDYALLGGDGDDWFLNGKNEIVGSTDKGSVLQVRQGPGVGITKKAKEAMREAPPFGSPPFMDRIMQQILQRLTSLSPFGIFGNSSPFQQLPTLPGSPQPGFGGWGMPDFNPQGGMDPNSSIGLGYIMDKIGNLFNLMREMSQALDSLLKNIRGSQIKKPSPGAGGVHGMTKVNPFRAEALKQFDKILETFHQDEVTGTSGKRGDKADDMIRALAKNPNLVNALSTQQKGRLLQILIKQTSLKHGGNQTAALTLLRSAKNPAEFKEMLREVGGQLPLHRLMWDKDQGSFNFLLEKFGVKPWTPPATLNPRQIQNIIANLNAIRQ